MLNKNPWLLVVCAILVLQACQPDTKQNVPDVSDIEVDVPLYRFEQELFAIDTTRLDTGLAALDEKYPIFAQIYFERILGSKDAMIAPEGHVPFMRGFLRHPAVRHLYDTTQVVYKDMSALHRDFEQAFRYYKYYFPEQPVPDITTFISEYSIAAFIYGDNSLAVGLDFFLGEKYPYQGYNPGNSNFSEYLTRTFNKEHLVAKTLQPLVDEIVGPPNNNRMIDFMINNGKKMYLLDLLLPTTPDSVKLEVTPAQVQWLNENEQEMWAYFLQENLLYNNNFQEIRKFIEYSPNSPGMPAEAPGRTANYMGMQVVRAYMKRYPETTLTQLFEMQDAQALLEQSKYKPRKR